MGGAILIIGLLPMLVYVQALSVLFYGATLIGFAAWVALNGQGKVGDMLRAGLRFVTLAPMQVVRDIAATPHGALGGQDWNGLVRNLLRAWAWAVIAVAGAEPGAGAGATLRLDLYVDAFGLTYLQVAVLYICSLVNFANMIAASNFARGSGMNAELDRAYICSLGSMALPAIAEFERNTGQMVCDDGTAYVWPEIADWREWGFRKWQVQRYLVSQTPMKDAP